MVSKKYQPVFVMAIVSVLVFAAHKLLLHFFFYEAEQDFYYSLLFLYSFFCLCSMLILLILVKVKAKNINSVGQTFLLMTCIKMVAAYAVLYPLLHSQRPGAVFEKYNFLIIFLVFLTIETVITIRILNNKQ